MQLSTTYRGRDDPFEGDRIVPLRGLPAGALVRHATLTVTPARAAPPPPQLPFEELFVFGATRDGELAAADWGVTAAAVDSSLEVELHARRTLAAVTGTRLVGSVLSVDVGGLYVELNDHGAVRAPDDTAFPILASGALPGVTVAGFRLTRTAGQPPPSVDTVAVRSVPANVSVRLGTLGPFWTYVGELATPETTPDFAEILQAFLLEATVENGVYVIPFDVHADGIARLDLALELEYVRAQSLLPDGLAEVVLPFDLSTFARSGSGSLSVRLPAGAQVVPGATRARLRGSFDSTRLATGAGTGEAAAAAEAIVTAERAAAQAVEAAGDVVATGFDVFLAPLAPTVRLSVNLLGDSDGKPFGDPLLRAPLEARLSRDEDRAARWVTVPLDEPFHVEGGRRYWLVLQSLEGEASWPAAAAAAGDVPLQASADAGLSWSAATDARLPGALTALHRLRVTPAGFEMPISVDVGSGAATQHVSLRRFEPLGRVDLTLDTPELAGAFDAAVAAGGPVACPTGEHVANGDLDDWIGIGDELSSAGHVALQGSPRAVAMSRDGRRAYAATLAAGDSEGRASRTLLEPVELACAAAGTPIDLDVGGVAPEPLLLALDRREERAYVVGDFDGAWLMVADLVAGAIVGEPISFDPYTGLAVSPDGERLLLLRDDAGAAVIESVDTRTLERLVREGMGLSAASVKPVATIALEPGESVGQLPAPFAAVAAGGETLLAFTVSGHTVTGRLCLVAEERPAEPAFTPVGQGPLALAATSDGRRIVVVCEGDDTLSVVTGSRTSSVALTTKPVAVALAADGGRAAVLSATDVAVYDLEGRRRLASVPAGSSPTGLAGSPSLDVLLVAESEGGGLARYAAPAVPLEWTLTSGAIEPRCFGGDLGALLGQQRRVILRGGGAEPTSPREPSAISQVVPVSGGCRYEFAFRALADQPSSVGEVLWRDSSCGLAHADSVPITEIERPQRGASDRRQGAEPSLVLHRASIEAPTGADQAEVRFVVPAGGLAAVGFVSLRGSEAGGVNEDLQERRNGRPVGWTFDPEAADLSLDPAGAAVRLGNAGAAAGALVQTLTVAAGRVVEVELAGRTLAPGADPGPQLELRFLDGQGVVVGDPAVVPLPAQSFDRAVLTAQVPGGVTRAEVRLVLPAGAAVELVRVTVRLPSDVEVPVVFRAEAPGELAVQAAQVAYDTAETPPPGLPPKGLCPVTGPGEEPGAEPKPACGCCGSHETSEGEVAAVSPAGRPATLRRCARCGCRTVAVSGRPAPRADVLAASNSLGHARGVGLPSGNTAAAHALIDVRGVGPVRARKLARVGIASVERLAAANPEVVAAVLGGLSTRAAAQIVELARELALPEKA